MDLNDDLQLGVIQANANILATVFNIPMCQDLNKVKELASQVQPVKFIPKKIKIETDEKKKEEEPVEISEEDEV